VNVELCNKGCLDSGDVAEYSVGVSGYAPGAGVCWEGNTSVFSASTFVTRRSLDCIDSLSL
jgi:hypothetical protein